MYVHIFEGFPVWKHINRAKCSRNISQKVTCGLSLSLEEEYVKKYNKKIKIVIRGGYIMKISKKDALIWFEFFAMLPEEEEVMPKQQEIIYATFAQIEAAIDDRNDMLMSEIKNLKTLEIELFL